MTALLATHIAGMHIHVGHDGAFLGIAFLGLLLWTMLKGKGGSGGW